MLVYELLNMFPANTHVTIRSANGTKNGKIHYETFESGTIPNICECEYDDIKNVKADGKNKIIVTVF